MTDPKTLASLEKKMKLLRAQNRRYRELIQNLSSAIGILQREDPRGEDRAPVLEAFESFATPSNNTASVSPGDSTAGTETQRGAVVDGDGMRKGLQPLRPNPGWKCLAIDLPQIRIGFTLFGKTADEIENAVQVVEQRQVRSKDFTPIFVIDNPVFAPFRTRGYVVEYVSKAASADAVRQRLDFISAKWGLGETVDLGQLRRFKET